MKTSISFPNVSGGKKNSHFPYLTNASLRSASATINSVSDKKQTKRVSPPPLLMPALASPVLFVIQKKTAICGIVPYGSAT